jgi:uncharacterized protein YcfJ
MLTLFIVAMLGYSSKINNQYESATIGATVGGVAGVILSSSTPLGLIGGVIVGGWIGNKMESEAMPSEDVVTLRQAKPLNDNS